MALPVLSLSSLASKEVLAQKLDTRELPRHLHQQIKDYRRTEGAFTIREVHFEVARVGEGAVSEEEREEAWQYFLESDVGKIMMEFEVVVRKSTANSWSVSWAGEHKNTNIHFKNPVDFLNKNFSKKYQFMSQHHMNVHKATYLENGKVVMVAKYEEHRPKHGMSVFTELTSSLRIEESDSLTMVQQYVRPLMGLTFISTIKAPRAQSRGDREVAFGYETMLSKTGMLDLALRARKAN